MTLEERVAHLAFAESGPQERALFRRMLLDPALGDAFFINVCGMTHDPRRDDSGAIIGATPFLLWPAQEKAATAFGHAMDNSYDAGGEKSRDVGFTWIVLFCLVKRWLFVPGFSALIGHYVDELLDSSDDSSLFWRINFILKHLPPWLLPDGFDLESKEWRAYGKLLNPKIGTAITGAAPTMRFGVGARKSVIYFDDWARWEFGEEAYNSASAVTDCRITTWTVNPDDPLNHAYELRYSKGKFAGTKTKIINCGWKDDPRKMVYGAHPVTGEKTNLWLLRMLGDAKHGIPGRIGQATFDREYGGLYEIAVTGQIYGEQMPYVRVGRFPYDPRFPLYSVVDPGVGDECVVLWVQWDYENFRYRIIDCYHANGHGAAYYLPILVGKRDDYEQLAHEQDYDDAAREQIRRRTGWQRLNRMEQRWAVPYSGHFGDPAVKSRGYSDGKSFRQVLFEGRDGKGEDGVHLTCNDLARDFRSRIEESRRVLRFCDIDKEACDYLLTSLKNYKWNKSLTAPEHDQHSHAASAFQYFAVNDPHKEEFYARSEALATGRASVGMSVFGDIAALPKDVQQEILAAQNSPANNPFKLRSNRPSADRDHYSRPVRAGRLGGGGYGSRRG